MANREALRELQGRLAQRLAAARTETRKASWLAIECAGHGLLVPLATAGEIFPV
ncbi:MAG: chemotaxis protein CheW, partial [Rubrivivax sp.]|nr:chemotaxis protein CheW [Rubrivivax sp.]